MSVGLAWVQAAGRRCPVCPSRRAALAAGAAAVRSGKACRLWALCRWGRAGAGAWSSGAALAALILPGAGGGRCDLLRRRGAGVVIWCGGPLLAWSSGAVLAALILPGAGGRRCDLRRRRGAGVVIVGGGSAQGVPGG